jgi:hypothetical protein
MNTKQDLINQQAKLQKEADKLAEKISQMPDDDILMVPNNIHLNYGESILFNDDHQALYLSRTGYYAVATGKDRIYHQPHKLIPCDKDNLEIGKVYYRSNRKRNYIGYLAHYGVYDGSGFRCVFNDDKISSSNLNWSTILQAVPVED